MNNEIFGKVSSHTYVNSADAISRDRVSGLFSDAELNGSVKNSTIRQKIIESGYPIQIGETIIVGHVAIRREAESAVTNIRNNSYCKKHANSILANADFIKEMTGEDGNTLQWAYASALDDFVKNNCQNGKKEHKKSLVIARAKRYK